MYPPLSRSCAPKFVNTVLSGLFYSPHSSGQHLHASIPLPSLPAPLLAGSFGVAVCVNTTSKAMLAGWAGGRKIGTLVGVVSALALGLVIAAAMWSDPL